MLPNFSASFAWTMQYTYFPRVLVAERAGARPSGVAATRVSCIRTSVSPAERSARTRTGATGSTGFAVAVRLPPAGPAAGGAFRVPLTAACAPAFFVGALVIL